MKNEGVILNTTNSNEATKLTHGSVEAARASGASELCGGAGMCERTLELPPTL